jgi:serine/threonine-protein kinase
MPRARWVLPGRERAPMDEQLLAGPHGAAVARAAEDEAIILDLFARLSKEDRAMLPDVAPTARALVERVAHLAQALHDLDDVDDPRGADLRATFGQQLDNAAMALRNLRLDLVRLRSSGMRSVLADVSNATQQARALSRDIGAVLEAAAEVRNL